MRDGCVLANQRAEKGRRIGPTSMVVVSTTVVSIGVVSKVVVSIGVVSKVVVSIIVVGSVVAASVVDYIDIHKYTLNCLLHTCISSH